MNANLKMHHIFKIPLQVTRKFILEFAMTVIVEGFSLTYYDLISNILKCLPAFITLYLNFLYSSSLFMGS